MTAEEQQRLADELEAELCQPTPEPPPAEATRESYEALLKHSNNPVYPEE